MIVAWSIWVIDFNGMLTRLELFYDNRLGDRVHIYIFVQFLKSFFYAHCNMNHF